MNESGDKTNGADDDAAERALRDGLRAPALSADAMQRIRAAAQQEWRAAHLEPQVRPRARRWLAYAAAASVALLAGVVGWNAFITDSSGGAVVGLLARFDAPGIVESRFLRPDAALTPGASLHTGQILGVRGDSLISLAGGGNLRVARASAFEVVAVNVVKLERGELYVDIPPGARGNDQFRVVTPAGEFRHVGTQFAVAIINGATRLRVREGSVQWHASDGDSTMNAGMELVIEPNGKVTQRPIGPAAREWAWTESMAPDIDIENRPLREFLEWFARETGRKLELADNGVREQADLIRMHGEVRGLSAVDALTAVMASTTLRFELRDGAIRVSSARDSTTPAN